MRVIYVDVLVGVNLVVNYFLLLAVARLMNLPAKTRRLVLGAAVGAACALTALLPELPAPAGLLLKLLVAVAVVLAAFGRRTPRAFLRALAAFYITSFGFAGAMLALWYFLAPQGLYIRNSVVYFDVSPLLLIALAVVCYGLLRLLQRLTGRTAPQALTCTAIIERGGRRVELLARVDTGNSLTEPFSGLPVLVAQEKDLLALAPERESMRVVPFVSAGGRGLLQAFRPERLTLICGEKRGEAPACYVALCKENLSGGSNGGQKNHSDGDVFSALLNPAILPWQD